MSSRNSAAGSAPVSASYRRIAEAHDDRVDRQLSVAKAFALGALQGPTEILPVSSSAHLVLVPWLLGWRYGDLDAEQRKAFEVALHGAAGLALAVALREDLKRLVCNRERRNQQLALLSLLPSVALGYALERPIEKRLGTPETVAAGLVAGAVAMAWTDRMQERRKLSEADARDALWLGLAQACALFPGISRGGATLAAARLRRFTRADAHRISRQMALPVIAGAVGLKGLRLGAGGLPDAMQLPFLAGALAAFASTLACARLLRVGEGARRLAPYAAYRIALGAAVMIRLRLEPR